MPTHLSATASSSSHSICDIAVSADVEAACAANDDSSCKWNGDLTNCQELEDKTRADIDAALDLID